MTDPSTLRTLTMEGVLKTKCSYRDVPKEVERDLESKKEEKRKRFNEFAQETEVMSKSNKTRCEKMNEYV